MAYVDNYPQVALGECMKDGLILSFKTSGIVTKGMMLKFVVAALDLPTVESCGAADAWPAGVAMNAAPSGGHVSVAMRGCIIKVRAAGAITAGDLLITGAAGTVDTVAANTQGYVIGKALMDVAAAADDFLMEVGGVA